MKKILKQTTILTILFFTLCISFTSAGKKTDRVDELFAQWDKPYSPGCALAVIENGEIIYENGYGMANLEHNIPITPDSVFYIGSVSKQFVTMCIALLVKKGKLSLDDDIRIYIPELPEYGTPITIRNLIFHTSGIRDYLSLENLAGIPFGFYHEEEALELITRQKELNFKPGDEYLYSNSGYFLLAVIVERASGKSLREFADKHIFKPLGMKNSHFHDDYTMLIKNRASGYYPSGKRKFMNFISTFDCIGSGGLYTSVRDLYLWDQNFYHMRIGGQEVMDMMHTTGTLKSGKKLDYAFALAIGRYKGLNTVSHGGALGGYRSALIRFPEQNFSVICLSNLSSFNPTKLCHQVADIYLSGQLKEEEKTKEPVKFIKLSRHKLKDKAGIYYNPERGEVRKISLKGKILFFDTLRRKYRLGAVSENEFRIAKIPETVILTFKKQEREKPTLLHIQEEGEERVRYEERTFEPPAPEQLKEYTGDYYSDEIEATYTISLREEKLYFTHKKAPENPLIPRLQDVYSVRSLMVRFYRDEEEKIIGFRLDAGRVRNLKFCKESP